MEKIDPFDRTVFRDFKKDKKKIEKRSTPEVSFLGLVEEAEGKEFSGSVSLSEVLEDNSVLEELLDGIHEEGDKLKSDPSLDNIKAYKDAVRKFIALVIKKGYYLEENISGINILKRKKLTLIKILDQKLEKLAAGILSNQKDQMDLLRRLEEINGLLVDLLH